MTDFSIHAVNPAVAGTAPRPVAAPATMPSGSVDDSGGPTFDDLLDVVNPLHHLPIVGTLYRAITGDQIKPFTKVAGDYLYGGPTGFLGAMADLIFEKVTGKDFGDTVLSVVEDVFSSDTPAQPTGVASTEDNSLGDRIGAFIEGIFDSRSDDTPATTAVAAAPDPVAVPSVATHAPLNVTGTPVPSGAPALPPPAAAHPQPAALETIVIPGQDALLMALSRNGVNNDVAIRAADAYRRTLGVAADAALRGSTN